MRIQCPHCRQALEIADAQAGQVMACPLCGGQLRAPEALPPAIPPGAAAAAGKRCPHCGELIQAAAIKCLHCGSFLEGAGPAAVERDGPPWEQRDRLGLWPAIFGTIKGTLLSPVETFSRMKLAGLGPAMGYTALVGGLGTTIGCLWGVYFLAHPLVDPAAFSKTAPPWFAEFQAQLNNFYKIVYLALAVMGPLVAMMMAVIEGAVVHVGLKIFGGAKEPIETTIRAVAYGFSSAKLLAVIPFCGGLAGFVWAIVANIIGVARAHNVSYVRAAAAVLVPLLVLFVLCGCCLGLLVFRTMGAALGGAR